MAQTYTVQPLGGEPAFSIAPYSTRMVAAYQDRAGRYQLFTDAIDHHRAGPFRELDSWDAVIRYYASDDLRHFTDRGVAIDRGAGPATSQRPRLIVSVRPVRVSRSRGIACYCSMRVEAPPTPLARSHTRCMICRGASCWPRPRSITTAPIGSLRQARPRHGLRRAVALHPA